MSKRLFEALLIEKVKENQPYHFKGVKNRNFYFLYSGQHEMGTLLHYAAALNNKRLLQDLVETHGLDTTKRTVPGNYSVEDIVRLHHAKRSSDLTQPTRPNRICL